MTRFSLARPDRRYTAVRERPRGPREAWPESAPWHRSYRTSASLGPFRDLGWRPVGSVLAAQATLVAAAAAGTDRAPDLRGAARGLARRADDPALRRACLLVLWRARRCDDANGAQALCSALGTMTAACGAGGAAAADRLRFRFAERHALAAIRRDAALRLADAAEAEGDRHAAKIWRRRALT